MKKKIIALLLCLCTLLPCFALFVGADDTVVEYDSAEYNPDNKGSWVQASDGQYYNSEWAKFIDVEEYISKARTDGYEHMQLIDVEEYFYINSPGNPEFLLCLYVYNPERKDIPMNGAYGVNYNCGSIAINGWSDVFMSYEYAEGYSSTNNMFQRIFVPSTTGLYVYSDFGIDPLERKYEIEYLEFALYSDFEDDIGIIDTLVEKLVVNHTYSFTGANATKTQKVDGVSSPFNDLSMLLDVPKAELVKEYPVNGSGKPSLVFLEEYGAGTDDFELYIYVYNPRLLNYSQLMARFYVEETYQSFTFEPVSSESTLSKFKIRSGHEKFKNDISIREYYISNITLTYRNANKKFSNDYIYNDARYVYSDIPTENFDPSIFSYDISDTLIDAPSFAGNGNYCFTTGERYLLTFESKDIDGYGIIPNTDEYIITDEGDNWVEIEIIDDVSMLSFKKLAVWSLFPDAYYPDLSISIMRIIPEDATDEEKAAIEQGSISVPIDIDFGATRTDPVMITADEEEYVEPNAIYLTAEVDGEIEIEGNYTYYRLDSSVNGKGLYQTLSTLYFSLPDKYLQSSNIPIVDMYVSAIELSYKSAMTKPIIYVGAYHDDFEDCLEDMQDGVYGKLYNSYPFIATTPKHLLLQESVAKILFCDSRLTNAWRGSDKIYDLSGSNIYKYPSLIIRDYDNPIFNNIENEGDVIYEISELLSTEGFNNYLNDLGIENCVQGSFVDNQYVLNFDDKLTLQSFNFKSFDELKGQYGFIEALRMRLLGTKQDYMQSINDIKAIITLQPTEIQAALLLRDELFSQTYYVALSDVSKIKEQMTNSLKKNECFVFLRFDVDDYYSEFVVGGKIAEWFGTDLHAPIKTAQLVEFDNDIFCFQTKYYKGLDILRLEASNKYTTKLYKTVMDEIDTPMGGVTNPKPPVSNSVEDALSDKDSDFNKFLKNFSILLVVALIIFVIVWFWPVIGPIITAFFKWLGRMFVKFREWLKRIVSRKRE